MRKLVIVIALLLGFLPLPFCVSMASAMEPHDMSVGVMVHAASYDIMPCCLDVHEHEDGHSALNELPFRLPLLDVLGVRCYELRDGLSRTEHRGILPLTDRGKFEEQGGIKRE